MNENIISKKELDFILKFIDVNIDLFQENIVSPNRKFITLHKKLNPPNIFFDIKKRILIKENILDNYVDDIFSHGDIFGDYIGIITNGGKIHYHIDKTPIKYNLFRFNLFLSIPERGGFPVYNGITIPVKVGDYVKCNSSKEYHECEMVEGNIPRIVISYGIYLKNEKNKLISYQ
jgi:hypothetical protein